MKYIYIDDNSLFNEEQRRFSEVNLMFHDVYFWCFVFCFFRLTSGVFAVYLLTSSLIMFYCLWSAAVKVWRMLLIVLLHRADVMWTNRKGCRAAKALTWCRWTDVPSRCLGRTARRAEETPHVRPASASTASCSWCCKTRWAEVEDEERSQTVHVCFHQTNQQVNEVTFIWRKQGWVQLWCYHRRDDCRAEMYEHGMDFHEARAEEKLADVLL